uniref:Uncharacterized protein n=1 Tax=Triatoma dimidiata TaxID=72491 RepID=Q9G7Z9_TRIDM|nr:unknown [Triatoma dimidiata]
MILVFFLVFSWSGYNLFYNLSILFSELKLIKGCFIWYLNSLSIEYCFKRTNDYFSWSGYNLFYNLSILFSELKLIKGCFIWYLNSLSIEYCFKRTNDYFSWSG